MELLAPYSRKQLTDAQRELIARPLPKEAVKPHPTKQGLSAIKPIYVTERLNDVFGIGGWTLKTELLPVLSDGSLFRERTYKTKAGQDRTEFFSIAKTIIEVPDYGIYYECIAGASNDDMGDSAKGSTTDCITKICSYLGIGIAVFKGIHDEEYRIWEQAEKDKAGRAKEAMLAEEVEDAVQDLLDCKTVADLTKLKGQLPEPVVKHARFVAAAKARFETINNPALA